MRIHPDLADALNNLADESGLSRSLFVERVLISFVNQDPRTALDHIGRRVRHDTPPVPPPGSLASFGRQWQRWSALRYDVLGEEGYDTSPVFDGYGRDEHGHGQRRERPPVPKRLLAPDFAKPNKTPLKDRYRIIKVPAPCLADLTALAAIVLRNFAMEAGEEGFMQALANDELDVIAKAWQRTGFSIRKLQRRVQRHRRGAQCWRNTTLKDDKSRGPVAAQPFLRRSP